MNSRVLDVVRLKYPCKKSENWSLPCAISSPRSITAKRIFQILDDWFPSKKIRIRIDSAQLSSALLFESIDMNKKTSEKLRISMKKHNLRFGNGQIPFKLILEIILRMRSLCSKAFMYVPEPLNQIIPTINFRKRPKSKLLRKVSNQSQRDGLSITMWN